MRKTSDGSFELLIASAVTEVPVAGGDIGKETEFELEGGQKLRLVYGDRKLTGFLFLQSVVLVFCFLSFISSTSELRSTNFS